MPKTGLMIESFQLWLRIIYFDRSPLIKGCLCSRILELNLELIVNYDETENSMSYSQASSQNKVYLYYVSSLQTKSTTLGPGEHPLALPETLLLVEMSGLLHFVYGLIGNELLVVTVELKCV